MPVKYSDEEIDALLRESKLLPVDHRTRSRLRAKRGHKEQDLEIEGANGNRFRVILRQSNFNVLDFSIIVAVCPSGTTESFRLRRYNGKSHEHSNHIEENTFYDFHVHMATERYQELGTREDAYAEPTDRYADYHGAFQYMLNECGFETPPVDQLTLI